MATTKRAGAPATDAAALIDRRIAELGGWRGATLERIREIIRRADPDVVEEWKWGTPVWSHDGIICTGEAYKAAVKMTFAKGASLPDPAGLFNASLEGKVRRAIDVREGETIDARALTALVRAAVATNTARAPAAPRPRKPAAPRPRKPAASRPRTPAAPGPRTPAAPGPRRPR